MTPLVQIKPGVRMAGVKPEMMVVLDVVPVVFARFGYDCWLTSCVRNGDGTSKHDSGEAMDFDSSVNVPEATGHEIAFRVNQTLSRDYDALWHGPRFHLHVEHDPKDG